MGATKRCLCLSIIFAFTIFSCDGAIENRIQKGLNRQNLEILNDEKLHVYLVGSGGPMNNSKRLPTCTAVIAGGQFLLVDAGPGTWRNADLLNLPIGNLTAILLTHFHSDHIGDLGEVNFGSWFAGRKERLEIFGPEGVDRVVKGFSEAYALDTSYRVAHHGADVMNPEVAIPISRTIKLKDADSSTPVLDRNGLKVYAFSVDHAPVNPAFGYRFEYKGNMVVISGDTKKTANLVRNSQNADILISNGLSFKLMGMASKTAAENNRPRIAKITQDVMDYQLDPRQAGEIAQAAAVKTLVFNHIVPPVENWFIKRMFLDGVDDIFKGKVIMGEDGMSFSLDPKTGS